ncbi:MAG: hypothetical protein PWP76_175 [Candidatus Diapherotrites archaeon]|nr:hypothetical protein [Candidatus Diapherotrites archaeon]MDN5366591.1 hypothetical protein [Candidatus Diapherotrites archaeon]
MRKDRVITLISLLVLVFLSLDLLLIALELWGLGTPFVQVFRQDGKVLLVGSDLLVFILSVPVALILEQLWEKEKWAWFGEGKHPRKNVFAVFLVIFLLLAFAVMIGGYHVCRSVCDKVRSCAVGYVPFRVEILYSCEQIIPPPVPS